MVTVTDYDLDDIKIEIWDSGDMEIYFVDSKEGVYLSKEQVLDLRDILLTEYMSFYADKKQDT